MKVAAPPTAQRVNLGPVQRIPNGEGRVFRVGNRDIAVFRTRSGTVYATQAWCPHAGGPLADGVVGNGRVICPLHGYRFSLRTGEAEGHTCGALETYPVSVSVDGELILKVSGEPGDVPEPRQAPTRGPLGGRTVAVLETRMADTIVMLLEREGATVLRAPALREQAVEAGAHVDRWIRTLLAGGYDTVMFLTGVGATKLLEEVGRRGQLDAVRAALLRITVVARGPKPAAALNRCGVTVAVTVPEPWTTREAIATLRLMPLRGTRVALVHYGERSAPLAEAIAASGAILDELCMYEWRLPEDTTPLERLVTDVVAGSVDAVVFTTQVQVRHLCEIAGRSGRVPALINALNTRTVVASIGPTTSAALIGRGIVPRLEPVRPKLGPLVERVVAHFGEQQLRQG